MTTELYDAIADLFRRRTGLYAPGKDVPAAMGPDDYIAALAQFGAFWELLGPSDRAGILGMQRLREARE